MQALAGERIGQRADGLGLSKQRALRGVAHRGISIKIQAFAVGLHFAIRAAAALKAARH